jgi:thiamine biosynthesis lipoprotein
MLAHAFKIAAFSLALVTFAAAEKFSFERELMATRFTIVCYTVDRELSKKPIGEPLKLSPRLYDLLEKSRNLAEQTNGAFDPTLAPLTKLWRETKSLKHLPDPEKLKTALAAVGWKHFTLDSKTHSITLHRENIAFDLGGIAKGYAADLMLESLIAAGFSQSMVTAGGDIRLGDPPPGRDGWNVAVQTFDLNKRDEILTLSNVAVSTSGDLHQSVEIEGVKYSHVLDPSTGLGLTQRIAATVIADHAKLSDPIATAACVMGPDAAEALKKLPGVRDVKIRTLQEAPIHSRYESSELK